MSYRRQESSLFYDGKFWACCAALVIYAIYWMARASGWQVDEKNVICSKGGEAYTTINMRTVRVESKDALCKQ